jgi:hypothetical protein
MSELIISDRRAATKPASVPELYRNEPPVSRETLADWQRQLNAAVPPTDKLSHLLILWEPGDEWMPIQRFFLWQCVDPKYHEIEPWILAELRGPAPRTTGHPCFAGYCLCDVKRARWVEGACKYIDQATWQLYQDTGLYGTRWWVIQGEKGGHRKRWEVGGLESTISNMKGHGTQPPVAGDLPYAPFDQRVLTAVLKEKQQTAYMRAIVDGAQRRALLTEEEEAERQQLQREVWNLVGEQVDALWEQGADLLPRYFEEQFGRVPTGTPSLIDPELVERQFISGE